MYKTFSGTNFNPNAQPKPGLKAKPTLLKQNTKLGLEEGALWELSAKPIVSVKSKKALGVAEEDDDEEEQKEEQRTEDHAPDPHANRTTTPIPIIGVQVPLRVLPGSLLGSTIAGAVCMFLLQLRILRDMFHSSVFSIIYIFLLFVTLCCMFYCMFADPGVMQKVDSVVPDRAHKTWLYERPIYRYDHYCRWIMNCIGLLNHREFMIMLIGLVVIAITGAVVDVVLIIVEASLGAWLTAVAIFLHFLYSMVKYRFVGEILRMHIGFVSRNELCNEWKEDLFWRVQPTSVFNGKMLKDMSDSELLAFEEGKELDGMIVSELSVDTYNAMIPETNRYDPSLNKYDNGWSQNCWSFWLTRRSKQNSVF